ncbi:MAG: EVE domain-containing protein [Pseudomonadota bacterium]
MQRYWIAVAHRKQALAAASAGVVAVSHGKEAPLRKLSTGDGGIYYAPKSDFEGETVQAFVALARVTGADTSERTMPGSPFRPFGRDAESQKIIETPLRPMLEDLGFVRSPRHRGMAFLRPFFEIENADYQHSTAAMGDKA